MFSETISSVLVRVLKMIHAGTRGHLRPHFSLDRLQNAYENMIRLEQKACHKIRLRAQAESVLWRWSLFPKQKEGLESLQMQGLGKIPKVETAKT